MCVILKAKQEDVLSIKRIEVDCGLSPWTEADYLHEIDNTDNLFYVAKNADKVVGFVLARLITSSSSDNSYEIEIYNLAVADNYRRNQIASELLDKICTTDFGNGVRTIYLEVRKSNSAAQKFYKKHFFSVYGERKNFYKNPSEDAVLMMRFMKSI